MTQASSRPFAAASEPICIELSESQIAYIVGTASAGDSLCALFSQASSRGAGLASVQRAVAIGAPKHFSSSLLMGLTVLAAFPADGSYVGNAALARELELDASTAHRYISTLLVVGLIERDPDTRRYKLARALEDRNG